MNLLVRTVRRWSLFAFPGLTRTCLVVRNRYWPWTSLETKIPHTMGGPERSTASLQMALSSMHEPCRTAAPPHHYPRHGLLIVNSTGSPTLDLAAATVQRLPHCSSHWSSMHVYAKQSCRTYEDDRSSVEQAASNPP
jgi:hypothetical protein